MNSAVERATSCEPQWYAVLTKRFYEQRAHCYLAARDIESYLPRTRQWPKPAVGSDVVPLFPGYLFVRIAVSDYERVAWCPGIKEFVAFGDQGPSVVPPDAIAFLKAQEGPDGLFERRAYASDRNEVRVTRGSFKDFCGIVKRRLPARQRVVLLLNLLQRDVPVDVPEAWLKRA